MPLIVKVQLSQATENGSKRVLVYTRKRTVMAELELDLNNPADRKTYDGLRVLGEKCYLHAELRKGVLYLGEPCSNQLQDW